MDGQQMVFEVLNHSKLNREFQAAFEHATGVRISFEQPSACLSPRRGHGEGIDLRLLPRNMDWHSSGSPQREVRELILVDWTVEFYEAIAPVHLGEHIFGILRTGCIAQRKLTRRQLKRLALRHGQTGWDKTADLQGESNTFDQIPVLDRTRMTSICKILLIFAEYLARLSNQLLLQQSTCEPAIICRAKQFIKLHHRENVLLDDVANHSHVCTFYLCKLFKKVTGLTFSDFLMRTRVETAKELLLDGTRRINEVALDAGFQSLTNFNRVFKQVVGESPREFRKHTLL